jgi:phosphoribosylaminoimidazolecarboxamide formyltransferase/IMP cyclohydrolase
MPGACAVRLRYGINPQQDARVLGGGGPLRVVSGAPSYINLLDAVNGWQLVREASAAVGAPVAASFKHVSPAGVAAAGPLDATAAEAWGAGGTTGALASAYLRARDVDPKSSFGDLVAVSEPVDAELAGLLARVVSDGIVAPGYAPGTVDVLARKKRGGYLVLEADPAYRPPEWERRDVFGLAVEQRRDPTMVTAALVPGLVGGALADALLGLVTVRYTQSNSVAVVRDGAAVGIGAGQQNRVDCVRLAGAKAATWWLRRHPAVRALPAVPGMPRQDRLNWQVRLAEGSLTAAQRAEFAELFPGVDTELDRAGWLAGLSGSTLVSDGYLPFPDNVEHAAAAGVTRIVEPGGSTRSDAVAAACAERGITLVRTGLRLFHH